MEYPAIRYNENGTTIRVENERQDKTLTEQGWRPTPFPPKVTPIEMHRGDLRSLSLIHI